MWNLGLGVSGAGGRKASPHVVLHPTQLIEVKIAVKSVFPTFRFPSKQSCISSKPPNIYFNIPPII